MQVSKIFLLPIMLVQFCTLWAQQPNMSQLVGINIKPQQNASKGTKFNSIRSWHLFSDDISQGGGGMEMDALSMLRLLRLTLQTRNYVGIPVTTLISSSIMMLITKVLRNASFRYCMAMHP